MGLGGRVAFVHLVHRQMEAAVQLSGEAARALGIVVCGTIGVERNADDERIGFPLGDEPADGCAVRVTVLPDATPTRLVPKSNARKER